jgi:hypothetical protein
MERHIVVLLSLLLILLFSCHASAASGTAQARRRYSSPLAHRHRVITAEAEAAAAAAGTGVPKMVQYETRYYTQRLDHFNAAPASYRTFQQRYLVNATYWGGKTAPVFVYAGNEGDVELFTNNTGFMWELAPRFRAMLVFIEVNPTSIYNRSPRPSFFSSDRGILLARLVMFHTDGFGTDAASVLRTLGAVRERGGGLQEHEHGGVPDDDAGRRRLRHARAEPQVQPQRARRPRRRLWRLLRRQ